MTIDFYYLPGSAPCRAVLMTAKALGLEMNLKLTNLMAGEHMTPEFLKINPQHCIPTLVDEDGFSIWESRAIMIYLFDKYGKDDSLYPKCLKKRATVNQRLYFDMGKLYQAFAEYWYPQLFAKQPANPDNLKKMNEAVELLDKFLEGQKYVAGTDSFTLADLSIAATICTFEVAGYDFTPYKNVHKWLENAKKTFPGYDLNQAGADEFKAKFMSGA